MQQILQAAVANGVTGVSPPVSPGSDAEAAEAAEGDVDEVEEPPAHPRAEEALLAGDVDTAIQEYQAVLAAAPADQEAVLGLALG